MANLDNRPAGYGASVDRSAVGVIDEGLRAFMLRVYNYMAIGLAITGVAAYGVYSAAVSSVPTDFALRGGLYLTSFGAAIYGSPLMWIIVLAPLALVFFLSFRIAVLDLPCLHDGEHHPGLLHHGRDVRRDEPLGLHDAA